MSVHYTECPDCKEPQGFKIEIHKTYPDAIEEAVYSQECFFCHAPINEHVETNLVMQVHDDTMGELLDSIYEQRKDREIMKQIDDQHNH